MSRLGLTVLIAIFLCVDGVAQNKVGRIVFLEGTARLRSENGKVVLLTEKNYAKSLQPNQKLKLDKNARIEILLCDQTRPPIKSGEWYTVSATVVCSPENSSIQRVIEQNFRIIARQRGPNSFILSPIESSEVIDVIRPETAILRWASSTKARLTLSISVIGTDTPRWSRTDVPGEVGYIMDNDLRAFLKGVRDQYPNAKLQLNIQTATTNNSVIFELLPEKDEQALQRELMNVAENNKLLLHLFRADIYLRYKLFTEAANEYEQALKLCPESLELLRAAAATEKEAGNLTRSDELEDSIENLSKSIN